MNLENRFKTKYLNTTMKVQYMYKPFDKWEIFFEANIESMRGMMDAAKFGNPHVLTDMAAVINDPLRLKRFYHVERVH